MNDRDDPLIAALRALDDDDPVAPPSEAELARLLRGAHAARSRRSRAHPLAAAQAAAAHLFVAQRTPPHPPPPPKRQNLARGLDAARAERTPRAPARAVEIHMDTGRHDLEVVWVLSEDLQF